MGYDMYCEAVPPEALAEAEQRRKRGFALYAERDAMPEGAAPGRKPGSITWDESTGDPEWWRLHRTASAEVDRADELRGYFRLNVWGMGLCLDVMSGLGMLDVESRSNKWPRPADFDLAEWPDSDETWPADSAEARYLAACESVRRGRGAGLIPAFKFSTNDGWLVTPDEIRASLAVIADTALPSDPPWFQSWLDYLAKAADLGGFRVR